VALRPTEQLGLVFECPSLRSNGGRFRIYLFTVLALPGTAAAGKLSGGNGMASGLRRAATVVGVIIYIIVVCGAGLVLAA
jgi:hypothetical protein